MTTPTVAAPSRTIHPDALALARHFEGLYLSAYLCPAGVSTIGYGHTAGVEMGQDHPPPPRPTISCSRT